MSELIITEQNFEQEVLKADKPVLIDLWAVWCGPCKILSPIVEELAKEYEGKIKVGRVNVDENPDLTRKYDVVSIPTLILFKNGKIASHMVGVQPKTFIANEINKNI
jgi:thioredoxin 1